MIRYLAALALAVPMIAIAQGISGNRAAECGQDGWLVNFAVTMREDGFSPQEALRQIKANHPSAFVLDDSYVKHTINTIYFDGRLQGIPADVLSRQVSNACLFPPKQYVPLK